MRKVSCKAVKKLFKVTWVVCGKGRSGERMEKEWYRCEQGRAHQGKDNCMEYWGWGRNILVEKDILGAANADRIPSHGSMWLESGFKGKRVRL